MDVAARFREYVRLDRQRGEGGLSLAEMQRWRALQRSLATHFAPGLPRKSDDPRGPVSPTRIKVSFAAELDLARCLMTNVSRGGVFVQTDDPLELKTVFTLVIHIESPPADIAVPVEVVSVGIGPGFARDKRGMGLRFVELSPETDQQLRALRQRAMR